MRGRAVAVRVSSADFIITVNHWCCAAYYYDAPSLAELSCSAGIPAVCCASVTDGPELVDQLKSNPLVVAAIVVVVIAAAAAAAKAAAAAAAAVVVVVVFPTSF